MMCYHLHIIIRQCSESDPSICRDLLNKCHTVSACSTQGSHGEDGKPGLPGLNGDRVGAYVSHPVGTINLVKQI